MSERGKIGVAFAAIYLIWGSTYLAIARTVADVPPIFMVSVRGLLAGGILYLWVRRRGARAVTIRELAAMVPTAALLFGGGYVLVGWAEQSVPSGPAALLNATTPAWVVLFEWLAGRRTRPSLRFVIALALGVAGVGVLVGVRGDDASAMPLLEACALIGASVAWGAGTLRARMHANGDPVRDAAIQLLTGGLLLLPFSALFGELPHVANGFTNSSLAALGYLVIVGSLTGYSAYVYLLHHVPASKVASHSYVNPLIAVIIGAAIAGEQLTYAMIAAAALILVSVAFIVGEPKAGASRGSARRFLQPRIAAPAESHR
jgi:drug/metabolite transporter (DMT)-like permease